MNLTSLTLPPIVGERVILRPITAEDTPRIVAWRNDPEVLLNFIYRGPFTEAIHQNWLATKVASGQVVQFIILERASGRPVGSVYFRDVNPDYRSAEYGIFIGEADARGKGLGTETARLFTGFGLNVLRLHRISLKVLGGNEIARHSYEKAGFCTEGVFRDFVKLDGVFTDVVFMAKLGEG